MNDIAKQALAATRKKTAPAATIPASRIADKFVIRLPDDLRPRVKAAAEESDRSMNGLVVQAIRQFLDGQDHQQMLLDALESKLAALGHPTRSEAPND